MAQCARQEDAAVQYLRAHNAGAGDGFSAVMGAWLRPRLGADHRNGRGATSHGGATGSAALNSRSAAHASDCDDTPVPRKAPAAVNPKLICSDSFAEKDTSSALHSALSELAMHVPSAMAGAQAGQAWVAASPDLRRMPLTGSPSTTRAISSGGQRDRSAAAASVVLVGDASGSAGAGQPPGCGGEAAANGARSPPPPSSRPQLLGRYHSNGTMPGSPARISLTPRSPHAGGTTPTAQAAQVPPMRPLGAFDVSPSRAVNGGSLSLAAGPATASVSDCASALPMSPPVPGRAHGSLPAQALVQPSARGLRPFEGVHPADLFAAKACIGNSVPHSAPSTVGLSLHVAGGSMSLPPATSQVPVGRSPSPSTARVSGYPLHYGCAAGAVGSALSTHRSCASLLSPPMSPKQPRLPPQTIAQNPGACMSSPYGSMQIPVRVRSPHARLDAPSPSGHRTSLRVDGPLAPPVVPLLPQSLSLAPAVSTSKLPASKLASTRPVASAALQPGSPASSAAHSSLNSFSPEPVHSVDVSRAPASARPSRASSVACLDPAFASEAAVSSARVGGSVNVAAASVAAGCGAGGYDGSSTLLSPVATSLQRARGLRDSRGPEARERRMPSARLSTHAEKGMSGAVSMSRMLEARRSLPGGASPRGPPCPQVAGTPPLTARQRDYTDSEGEQEA
eukprot:TRINITY_DN29040_c0_g1_i1.p1 TRINITY_DN29040_c0_g1~~TRINITY_DN29040_c0_g1_i1.p1  ORF type:complete len:679 (-),score=95.57 TRINITY_DN29040_c0_g1_i1:104-2140(-)